MKTFIIAITLVLYSSMCFGSEWKVILSKGKVLHNGIPLKTNPNIHEGDTLTTGKGSFVKISYENANTIVLGPNGSMKVNIIKNESNVIDLLRGQIRAKLGGRKTEAYKLQVKTKTASMGVRGTDFHVTYNNLNNITSSISYEGSVEMQQEDTDTFTKIRRGHVASVSVDGLNLNTKMSPKQFHILEKNSNLDFSKKATKRKKSDQIVTPAITTNTTFEKDKSLIPVPKDLLGDEHKDFIEEDTGVKPGGFVDLATGIYIAPPANSKFDSENDVYIPPKEFGDVDPLTGGYTPPYGLILHPLKGFVLVSEKIEETIAKSRKFITKMGKKAVNKTIDVVKGTKDKLVEATGIVGETAEKTTEFVVDSALKTGSLLADSSGKVLNTFADNMNKYINHGILRKVSDLKKRTYLKYISATAKNRFSYQSSNRFYSLGHIEDVVKVPSFANQFFIKGSHNFKLSKLFLRPTLTYEKTTYLNDEHDAIRSIKNTQSSAEVALGFQNKFKKGQYLQVYMFYKKGKRKKFSLLSNDYKNYLRTKSFGLSKLLIGRELLTSKFTYEYLKYQNVSRFSFGDQHLFSLTEIINLSEKNFANFEIHFSRQKVEKPTMYNISELQFKFNYFFFAYFYSMKLNCWYAQTFSTNDLLKKTRDREKIGEFGLSLKKSFGQLFHVQFDYSIHDIDSDDYQRDDRAHRFGTEVLFYF